MMRYIAIDFETANEKRNSACSIGIAVYENYKLKDEKYWLIKPPEMIFKPMNIWIHGITPDMVEHENDFSEIWPEILPYIENNLVIAHNASFDISVLRNTLDTYGIEYPSFKYACSVNMVKNYYENLENHKLNTVSNYLGIDLLHHHAGEDARACGEIVSRICSNENISSYKDLERKLGIKLGKVFKGGYTPTKLISKGLVYGKGNGTGKNYSKLNKEYSNYFRDKIVVFTGPLTCMSRTQAALKIREAGGEFAGTVTKKTMILVVGGKPRNNFSKDMKSSKYRKAEELITKGQDIEILNEEEFMKKLYK